MAWGGGGVSGVPGGMSGRAVTPGGSATGLPFAGIPHEMQRRVDEILAKEPDSPTPHATFSHRMRESGVSLRSLLRLQRGRVLLAVLLIVVEGLLIQAGPVLASIGIDDGIAKNDWNVLLTVALAAVAAVVISSIASGLRVALTGRIASRAMFHLRVRVFAHLLRMSLDYFTEEKAGVIMTRMTSDIEALQQLLQDGLSQFGLQALTTAAVTVVLFVLNVKLALITVLLILPILTALTLWFRSTSDTGYLRVRDGIASVLSDFSESLQGVRVVASFNRQWNNVLHHRNVVGAYRDANDYTAELNARYAASTEWIGVMGQAVLLLIGGTMVKHGSLQIGVLTAFILYLNSFFQPIQTLVQQYNLYQQGKAAIVKLDELLATQPTVEEAPDAHDLPPLEGDVRFVDVSFGYDPTAPVLRHVNLHIAAGETMSFVGSTGAGKSTIAKLVIRFYDPTDGQVLIDGHDLRDVTLGSLRHQLGVVPQEPYLFSGTLRANVAFARPGASEDEVDDAVHRVGLTDLIERLPHGLDTPVHERGVSLSSGERQLIALARAFLARPRVLVLDEATSNLDLKSETQVEAGLDALLQGRTAIIVAHRLSTAMRADRIAVVDDGHIVELGSHDELLELGGRYTEMYAAWMEHLSGAVT